MKTLGRIAALLAILAAGACHKQSEPPPAPTENIQPPAPPKPAPPPPPAPEKPKPAKTVVVVPPDADKPSAEDQMREDAEATGMTSRLTPTAPPGDDNTGGGNSQ